MSDTDLVFYVTLTVKPDRVEDWKAAVFEVIGEMQHEDAFVSCYMHQDSRAPNVFTLYERWREPSVEAFVEHQTKPYRVAYDAKLPDLLERPREPAVLTPIREWHKATQAG